MIKKVLLLIIICSFIFTCSKNDRDSVDKNLWEKASEICETNIILDSHIDWPNKHLLFPEDISKNTTKGDFDLVRANKGGLNAALSVAYIPPNLGVDDGRILVDSMLKLVVDYTNTYPNKFALARKPHEVKLNFDNGLFSFPLCLENGAPIGDDLEYLKYLKEQGIVYITLCHLKTNQISDSNFDTNRKWNGLSPFGLEVIKEMNHLGIIIDISHSTDSTVSQSLRLSKAPVIASHSLCRYFTPGLERNLSDTLIKAIAAKDGIVMINFGSFYLDPECFKSWGYLISIWQDSTGIDLTSSEGLEYIQEYGKNHELYSDSKKVVDHIEHVINLVGIDYVGIGSDYDGIFSAQPSDLPDVSSYPVIVYELLKRGYSEKDIKKILSSNFLRVWDKVIEIADSLNVE